MTHRALLAVPFLLALAAHAAFSQAVVRVHDDVTIAGPAGVAEAAGGTLAAGAAATTCGASALAVHNQPVTGGGTLNPVAFVNPAVVSNAGRIAFISLVNGVPRNQGVFVADGSGLVPIAMGCGGAGGSGMPGSGCGDPTPIGGTFGGFFTGTFFTPALNAAGDVLFLCDVVGGSSPRALFLFRAATASIVKVAAVGDPSPLGGTFDAVGPGNLNDSGVVVFLARGAGTTNSNYFKWTNGVVTKVAAIGDPAPGGGTMTLLGTESLGFADGTQIPGGPIPGINNAGDMSFRAIVSGGITPRGIVVQQGGVNAWYVKSGDAVPGGGNYFDFQGSCINASGQISFFADFMSHGSPTSGWFVGKPGAWRKALAFFDPIDTGKCFGLAFSRNPMTPLDDFGNLVLWTNVQFPNLTEQERLVVSSPTGALFTVAKKTDPTPIGGTYGTFDAWPSMNDAGRVTINASTPGAAGGALSAHVLSTLCGPTVGSVMPPFGPRAGGTAVTVQGSGFSLAGAPSVTFDGAAASGVVVLNDTTIQATTPPGSMGPADVSVANAFGPGALQGGFIYTPAVLASPAVVPVGGLLMIANYGFPPSTFATWASNLQTSIDFSPFGVLEIGPSPLFDLVGLTAYPAIVPHTAPIQVPADPTLSGVSFYIQSFSLDSVTPLAGTFTNVATITVQ